MVLWSKSYPAQVQKELWLWRKCLLPVNSPKARERSERKILSSLFLPSDFPVGVRRVGKDESVMQCVAISFLGPSMRREGWKNGSAGIKRRAHKQHSRVLDTT